MCCVHTRICLRARKSIILVVRDSRKREKNVRIVPQDCRPGCQPEAHQQQQQQPAAGQVQLECVEEPPRGGRGARPDPQPVRVVALRQVEKSTRPGKVSFFKKKKKKKKAQPQRNYVTGRLIAFVPSIYRLHGVTISSEIKSIHTRV